MKNCKNIWIFNHYAVTPDLPGGTRHFDFAKELTKRGYSTTIFASSFVHGIYEDRKLKNGEEWKVENYDGVNFVWIKTPPYIGNGWKRVLNMLSYSWKSYRLGKRINKISSVIKQPDIIIGSSVHPFAAYTGYKLSIYWKVPFIFEVRDLWPQTLIDLGKVSPKNPVVIVLKWLEKFLYRKASKIIVLLPDASEYIVPLGVKKNKIIWISNGVDLERFKLPKNSLAQKNNFVVLYTGAHGVANGLEVLLDAAKILQQKHYSNIVIKLVGDGPEKRNLINKTKQSMLKNILFEDPVNKSEIPLILSHADILFLGSLAKDIYKYGMSFNKLFDYLAAGKPIIFSSNASNNPVKESGSGLTVPPEDPRAVADAIIKLYNMSVEERESMGSKGREYVEKYYSIPVLVDKLEKTFEDICEDFSIKDI